MNKFRNFLFELSESLDSPVGIDKIKTQGYMTFYYIKFNNKKYRIFVERQEDVINIGFERKLDSWVVSEVTNDLTSKEILSLFSTVIVIVKNTKNLRGIFFSSDLDKKEQLYFNMARKIAKKLDLKVGRNKQGIFVYKNIDSNMSELFNISKFRYLKDKLKGEK